MNTINLTEPSEINRLFTSVIQSADQSELNWMLCHELERQEKIKVLDQLPTHRKLILLHKITHANH